MNRVFMLLGLVVVAAVVFWFAADCSLLTPDQRAYRLYESGDLAAATETFADPMWQGVCLFQQGEFEQAGIVFSGYDTPEAAFNQGNALVMQGKYEDAANRYQRALELRPDWEPAVVNLGIARARAAMLVKEGGDMSGGKMGADEIVFSDKKSPKDSGTEQTEGGEPMSDAALREVWLRQVQTKPADFLRAKFAYQHAMRESQSGGSE